MYGSGRWKPFAATPEGPVCDQLCILCTYLWALRSLTLMISKLGHLCKSRDVSKDNQLLPAEQMVPQSKLNQSRRKEGKERCLLPPPLLLTPTRRLLQAGSAAGCETVPASPHNLHVVTLSHPLRHSYIWPSHPPQSRINPQLGSLDATCQYMCAVLGEIVSCDLLLVKYVHICTILTSKRTFSHRHGKFRSETVLWQCV